jgi:hypothetical protein
VPPAAVTSGAARHPAERPPLATLARTLHPWASDAAAPPPSAQVAARWQAPVEAIEAFAPAAPWPERPAAMPQGKTPWPAGATRVDGGWQGVRQDGEHAAVSPPGPRWAPEV